MFTDIGTLPEPIKLTGPETRLLADWHAGQWSAMYAASSTGEVRSVGHARALAHELDVDIDDMTDTDHETAVGILAMLPNPSENPWATGVLPIPETGGYVPIGISSDGELFCYRCMTDPTVPVYPSSRWERGCGFDIIGWSHTGELDWCYQCDETDGAAGEEPGHACNRCAHCGEGI